MSAEYTVIWPPLARDTLALLTLKVASRSPVAFVREHWRRFDSGGMFVGTEGDSALALGDELRFCVIGIGALQLLAGRAVVVAIRRSAGGVPGLRLRFVALDGASRALHHALLEHAQHVEHVGAGSLPPIPPPLPRVDAHVPNGQIYRVRQRPVTPIAYRTSEAGVVGEFDLIETRNTVVPLDDDALR